MILKKGENEMNKQELIERIKKLPFLEGPVAVTVTVNREWILKSIEQLDEPQEVEIPMFAADFITEQKKLSHTLSYSIDACMSDRVAEWYWDNSELFAQAWIFGYEVEKEKRYLVKIKGVACPYLNYDTINELWFYNQKIEGAYTKTKHTRKELEDADFGWVFDCPGIEIEEVEE